MLDGVWGAFELDLGELQAAADDEVRFTDVITYPAVHRDLAFTVPRRSPPASWCPPPTRRPGPELREMRLDVYRGDQVAAGNKSIAFSVLFQSSERTLSDEDAAGLRKKIVDALAKRFGAELRA